MKVPEGIKKCVGFIGLKMADGFFGMAGTVFFVAKDGVEPARPFAITAKHVLEGIKSKGLENAFLRLNLKSGNAKWYETKINDWLYHEDSNVDIAILPIGFPPELDHLVYPLTGSMTKNIIKEHEIDVGDEVFITGLFRHHHGKERNIPIIRVGNIASIEEEKIQTREHLMDGYLIEARSIGGLSGSPVFVNLGISRWIGGATKQSTSGMIFFLMGLIYGHYDSKTFEIDSLEDTTDSEASRVNTGIAIVTPIEKLIDFIEKV